jgi:hypothetical protein
MHHTNPRIKADRESRDSAFCLEYRVHIVEQGVGGITGPTWGWFRNRRASRAEAEPVLWNLGNLFSIEPESKIPPYLQ